MPERVISDVVDVLAGPRRARFFAVLLENLSIAARNGYVAAGRDMTESVRFLTGMNEVMHVVANQLLKEVGLGNGYPDEAFVTSVLSRADQYGCGNDVREALTRSAR